MAKKEHKALIMKGVEVWNQWRKENPNRKPDLSAMELSGLDLTRANFSRTSLVRTKLISANLNGANLRAADLRSANLTRASILGTNLRGANLQDAMLSRAQIRHSNLTDSNLINADLSNGHLSDIDLSRSHLSRADLGRVFLFGAYLINATLGEVNLTDAVLHGAVFGNNDLSTVKGLDTVKHIGPSTIGADTIYKSKGMIPELFLRGVGLPESFIIQISTLIAAMQPIQFYSCFISYSSKDQDFSHRLYADLQNKGVRCWFAPEDLKIGDKIRDRIDESIRLRDKLRLIVSEHSIASDWVGNEVEVHLKRKNKEAARFCSLFA